MAILTPPPNLTVSEWADANRRLSPEASAEPGSWSTARAEYQRGIMNAVNDPAVNNIVVMSSAQIGKTEICNNVLGYHIDQDPAPILVVQPTLDMAQAWSKDRLATMLRDTPVLQGKVADPRSRDSGNTTLHKVFPGGHITACGANSRSATALPVDCMRKRSTCRATMSTRRPSSVWYRKRSAILPATRTPNMYWSIWTESTATCC